MGGRATLKHKDRKRKTEKEGNMTLKAYSQEKEKRQEREEWEKQGGRKRNVEVGEERQEGQQ